jgi:hypothetical protein
MPKIAKPPRVVPVVDPLIQKFRDFISFKTRIDSLTKEQNVLKEELNQYVIENGVEDDRGHINFELPEEVDGFRRLQRQRKVSLGLDIDAAILILTKKGLADRCIKSIPTVAEDEVMAALYEGKLTEEDIDTMFPKKVTWAFIPKKD